MYDIDASYPIQAKFNVWVIFHVVQLYFGYFVCKQDEDYPAQE